MANMRRECVRQLTETERRELQTLVKATSARVDRERRATAMGSAGEELGAEHGNDGR
jgi:hypothetical protein